MQPRSCLLFATLLALSACQTAAPSDFTAADRAAVEALDTMFVKGCLAGDFTNLTKHYYTADAVVMPPGEPAATGHAKIEASLRSMPPIKTMNLVARQISGRGDVAYSCGQYAMTLTPPGATISDTGNYLAVCRRQADGSWKCTHDMWNSDQPAAPAGK